MQFSAVRNALEPTKKETSQDVSRKVVTIRVYPTQHRKESAVEETASPVLFRAPPPLQKEIKLPKIQEAREEGGSGTGECSYHFRGNLKI